MEATEANMKDKLEISEKDIQASHLLISQVIEKT